MHLKERSWLIFQLEILLLFKVFLVCECISKTAAETHSTSTSTTEATMTTEATTTEKSTASETTTTTMSMYGAILY